MKRFYAFRAVRHSQTLNRKGLLLLFLVVSFLGFLKPATTYATHAAGADISYKWISGNTYEVTCTFFRDCSGVAAPNTVTLRIRSTALGQNFTQTLNRISPTGEEITFSCTGVTNCSGGSSTGIQRYVYRGNVTLPGQATDWNFSYQVCCRNCSITTIVHPNPCNSSNTTPELYVEATLNNVAAPQNSSPTFTVSPVAFICQGQLFNFNQGAVDANGDSLSYELITPKTSNTGTVTYIPPYSTTNFISSSPAASLHPATGQINMTPTTIGQVGILAVLVKEYRNGVLIGTTIRDIQIQIVNCSNQNPVISGINGTTSYEMEVCAGDLIHFQIFASDPDVGQNLTLTWNNGIGAPATFTSSGVTNPTTGTFNWQTTLADGSATAYSFVASVKDNGCFYNNTASYAYTIHVRKVTATITPTHVTCFGLNNGSANVNAGGLGPFTYVWSNSATTQTITNLSPGTYTVTVTGALGCSTTSSVTITEPAILDVTGVVDNDVACYGANTGAASVLVNGGTTPYTYIWSNGSTTNTASNLAQGTYTVTVKDAKLCSATVSVTINQAPQLTVSIASNQPAGCQGESTGALDITVSGGTTPYSYSWSNGATTEDINLLPAGTYSVTVTDNAGCTVTQTETVFQPSIPVPLISSTIINGVNIVCYGTATGDASVSVTGGTGPYNYLWSNGATVATITGLTAGTISVTVSDQNGCSDFASYTITEPLVPFIIDIDSISNFNGANVSCNGNDDGAVYTSISGGTAPYTYIWSNGETTSSITGLSVGTYSVTATDAYGCTATNTATINPLAPLTLSVTSPGSGGYNIQCHGEASGEVNTLASGGTTPYSYVWNTGATTSNLVGVTAGTYSVTLTDINGCSATGSVTLTQPDTIVPLINVPVLTGGNNLLCFGDANADASVSVTGGTLPYTYLWSNGVTDDHIYNLSAGTISVTIHDANNCSAFGSFNVTQPNQLLVSLSPNPALNCGGIDDGGINTAVSGGTGAYSFAWADGATTQNLSNLGEGTYSVTVTDENNCTAEANLTLTAPTTLHATSNVTEPTCNGLSNASIIVNVADGTPDYTFLWSNGTTDDNISGIGAGNYSVTITDGLGCSLVLTIPVNEPNVLSLTPISTNVSCYGVFDGEIDANPGGGTAPYSFIWSNGATNQVNIALVADTYSVTVTDANNCSATTSVTITQPDSLIANYTVTPQKSCAGVPDGSIDLTVTGGTAPYTYLWFNESTDQDITGLMPGTYYVTITDANNCAKIIDNIVVTHTDSLTAIADITQPNCSVSYNGQISLTVSGGTSPLTYLWSNGNTDATLVDAAGNYSVTITDAGSCTTSLTGLTINECCNINMTANPFSPGCGNQLGSIDLNPAGAVPPITYNWSNGETTEDINNLTTGTYSVTIEDANGCTATGSWSINAGGANITIADIITQPICPGDLGSISITANGGEAPYTYAWTNGATDDHLTGLAVGAYTVTVTDAYNCTSSATFAINPPNTVTITPDITSPGCSPGSDGAIDLTVSGGLIPYSFVWSNAETTEDLTGLDVGDYTITVTDGNNCTFTSTISVVLINNLSVNVPDLAINCSTTSYQLTANVSGGISPFAYAWSNGETGQSIENPTIGVTYSVTVTGANGCTATDQGTVTTTDSLHLTTTVSDYGAGVNVTCVNNNGSIEINVANGSSPFNVIWSNAKTTLFIDSLGGGTYSATVTDINGCTASATVTLIQSDTLVLTLTPSNYNGGYNISCNGETDGSINVSAAAGVAPFTYQWSNGSTQQNLTGIGAGTYTVTATDVDGCTGQATITLTEPDVLTASINTVITDCNTGGQQNITLTASAIGGTTSYTYQWSNGSTNNVIHPTASGNYSVTITDANGCISTADVDINVSAPLTITASQLNQLYCNSPDTAIVQVTINTGIAPYTYIWNNGATTDLLTDLGPGNYCVTVTDANNCSATACVNVSLLNNLNVSLTVLTQPGCTTPGGSIQATPANGTAPYSYTWSVPSQGDDVLTNAPAGNYSVTVTDAGGCTAEASIDLVQSPQINITSTIIVQPACDVAANGSLTFDVTGGVSPYLITINGNLANSGDTLLNLSAGDYTVHVTDDAGCTAGKTITVTNAPPMTLTFDLIHAISCAGNSDASLTVHVNNGEAPYTYTWSNGETTDTLSNIGSGTWSVTVTSALGCTAEGTYNITAPQPLQLTANVTQQVNCATGTGGEISLTVIGGTAPFVYAWSNGETGNVISNLTAGTYYFTVTDNHGCTNNDSLKLTAPTAITLTMTPTDITCGGTATGSMSVQVNGGNVPFTYVWSTGSTNATLTNVPAGNYCVTVSESGGCTAAACDNIVDINEALLISYVFTDTITCSGTCTAAIDLTIDGGVSPYTTVWSNGATTEDISNVCAGNYTIIVTDDAGCTASKTITVTNPPAMTLTFDLTHAISCAGNTDASLTVHVNNGEAPYTYTWSNGETTDTLSNIGSGTWSVTVTSALGCTAEGTYNITAPQPLQLTANVTQQVNCATGTGGEISLTVIGGTAPFVYAWSNGETGNVISNLTAGTYYFTVTDNHGCTNNDSLKLTAPTAITLTMTPTDITCGGTATGSMSVQVNGGNVPFTYVWSTGSTNATLTNVPAGNYCVTVSESGGCTAAACDSIVDINEALTLSYTFSDTIVCNGGCNAAINLTIDGGVSPYTTVWSNGATTEDISNVCAANYTVLVTDLNGCTANTQVTVSQPDPLTVSLSVVNQPACSSNNGCIKVSNVSAPAGTYTIHWSGSSSNNDTLCGLAPGTYSVTITTDAGCTATASITLNQPDAITINLQGASPCYNQCNGGISASATGGTASPYTFSWSNGTTTSGTTSLISDLCAGVYTVTVTDINGCSNTAQINLTPQAQASVNAGPDQLICGNPNTTTLDGTVVNISNYNWNSIGTAVLSATNVLSPAVTNLASGSNIFVLTGTSGINCVYSDTVIVTFINIVANAGPDASDCKKENLLLHATGQGTWSVIGGSVSLSSNTDPTATVTNAAHGENVLVWTVTQGGCTATDTVVLTLRPVIDCIDSIKIPTGFSPNTDGVNDNFEIVGIELYPNNELTIFNRWGNVVYYKKNYHNEWNGTNLNGEPLPDATYFVIFTSEEKNYKYSGYVDLRRQ